MPDVENEPAPRHPRHFAEHGGPARAVQVEQEADREDGIERRGAQRDRVGAALEDRELLAELSESFPEHLERDVGAGRRDGALEEQGSQPSGAARQIEGFAHRRAPPGRFVERAADGGEVPAVAAATPRRLVPPGVVGGGDSGVPVPRLGALVRRNAHAVRSVETLTRTIL